MKTNFLVPAVALLLLGCATKIPPRDDTQTPSTEALGSFSKVYVAPITNASPDDFPPRAADAVQADFMTCLGQMYPGVTLYNKDTASPDNALLIQPAILDAKKVSVGTRIFLGALAGSSAAQFQVTYTDLKNNTVIAQPIFYSKASAMSGTWTFGAEDNLMLNRLAQDACSYTNSNKTQTAASGGTTPPQ